jgi:hypothetical protein
VLNAQTPDNCRAWLSALQAWFGFSVPLTREFCAALSAGQLRLAYALLDKGSRVAAAGASSAADALVSSLVFRPSSDDDSAVMAAGGGATADSAAATSLTSSVGSGSGDAAEPLISAPQPATAEQLERAQESRQQAFAQLSASAIGGALMPASGYASAAHVAAPLSAAGAASTSGEESRKWLPKDKRTVSSKEWRAAHAPLNPAVAQWENEPFAAIHFQMCPPKYRRLVAAPGATLRRGVAGDRRRVVSMPPSSANDVRTSSTSSEREQSGGGGGGGGASADHVDLSRAEEMLQHERHVIAALQRMKLAFGDTDAAAATATDAAILAATQNEQQLELRCAAAQLLHVDAALAPPRPRTPDKSAPHELSIPVNRVERPALPPKPENASELVPTTPRAPTPAPSPATEADAERPVLPPKPDNAHELVAVSAAVDATAATTRASTTPTEVNQIQI